MPTIEAGHLDVDEAPGKEGLLEGLGGGVNGVCERVERTGIACLHDVSDLRMTAFARDRLVNSVCSVRHVASGSGPVLEHDQGQTLADTMGAAG